MFYEAITLALLSLRGLGPSTVRGLWQRFPRMESGEDVVSALQTLGNRFSGIAENAIVDAALKASQQLLENCEREHITVLGHRHPAFPKQLLGIPNPPLVLFVKGDSACLHAPSVAIIGTREPTTYGERCARKIAKGLAEDGWVIVSGLAEGCDTAGHEGCLSGEGKTVAFLAHGFGRIYPAKNKGLAERIVATGGCLATEYPPGQPPTRGAFVERDRLQSGLAQGVIVVETDVQGGTMHTVRHAAEQHRPLAAILHPEEHRAEPKAQGNLLLINEGKAAPLSNKSDLSRFVDSLGSSHVFKPTFDQRAPGTGSQGELNIYEGGHI